MVLCLTSLFITESDSTDAKNLNGKTVISSYPCPNCLNNGQNVLEKINSQE